MKNLVYVLIVLITFSCKNENEVKEESFQDSQEDLIVNKDTLVFLNSSTGALAKYKEFPSKFITPRPVDVWLPKDYTVDKKYSVVYMHDGQMLFDSTTTWNKQEWKVDEWVTQLVDEGKTKDFIVVAIHNIPEIRWQDLFPEKAYQYIDENIKDSLKDLSGKANFDFNGDNYLRFIIEELKPVIDSSYSVYTDRAHTFIMGSSMGGLMSMYAISEYPNVFSGAACVSTHWVGAMPMDDNPYPEAIFNYMEANLPKAGNHKLYFDYGNKTLDRHYPQYAPRVHEILKVKGYTDKDAMNLFFEDADHSENSWNKRLDQPLTFLLSSNE